MVQVGSERPYNVILVEGRRDEALLFRNALDRSSLFLNILHLPSAEDTLAHLEKLTGLPDLIVTNVELPGAGGLELCEQVQSLELDIALVLLTDAQSEDVIVKALMLGVENCQRNDGGSHFQELLPLVIGNALQDREDRLARVAAELRLEIEVERVKHADRAKSIFLANMSHELRTPLNAIIGFSEIIETELLGPLNEKRYQSYAGDIHSSANHLLSLISDILDISKIESGIFEIFETEVDVHAVTEDSVQMVRGTGNFESIAISCNIPAGFPLLMVDEVRLRQIIINLVHNAQKFSPAGSEIRIEWSVENDELKLVIEDDGIGMSPEEISVAMQVFGQVRDTYLTQHEGSGLGLPMVHKIALLHGGRFELRSRVGQGTAAIVHIPASRIVPIQAVSQSRSG
jgi:signal transduction histidine kinase